VDHEQLRNLIIDASGRALQFKVLIGDRAGQFTDALDTVVADAGGTRTPNDFSSPRTEVTDRILILGQRHLHRTLGDYARARGGLAAH
jgi:putative transposase